MILTLIKHQLVFIAPWAGSVHEEHRAGRACSHYSFRMRAPIDERIPLLQKSALLRNEGAHASVLFMRAGLYLTVTTDPVRGQNLRTLRLIPSIFLFY